MPDRVSKKKRSEVMSKVRSEGTKLEAGVEALLAEAGIDALTPHVEGIYGKPDFASEDYRVALFIDSCFWHGCPKHLRMPASNKDYWLNKIDRNRRRDRQVTRRLKADGWKVIRVWEHELPDKPSLKAKITRLKKWLADYDGK